MGKQGTPDSGTYAVSVFLSRIWLGGRQKIILDDRLLQEAKAPYIMLSNHESFEDFYYIARMAHPRNPSYVIKEHSCTRPVLRTLARRSGMVSKKRFSKDMSTGIGILRTIRKGYPLVVFPEGRLSPDGRTNPIVESGATLYRSLKTDLALVRIDGAYFAHPKWRKRTYRSEVRAGVTRILHADELSSLSDEEIDSAVTEGLYNDASADRSRTYPQHGKAKGLENLLYRCIFCGTMYRTKGEGNTFSCLACGRKLSFDPTYHFTEAPFSIPAYYGEIRRMEEETLDQLFLRAEVDTKIYHAKEGKPRREWGICTMTPECFAYHSGSVSFTVPTEEIPAMAFSCGKKFEIYYGDDLYFFYPRENRAQTARWALAADLLAERRNAGV